MSRDDVSSFFSIDPSYGDVVISYRNYPMVITNSAIYLESLDKKQFFIRYDNTPNGRS